MSVENARACLDRLESDQEFRTAMRNADTEEERLDVARDAGLEFTREEMATLVPTDYACELSDEELESVAAGGLAGEIIGSVLVVTLVGSLVTCSVLVLS